ncbi:MAG: hypothetical protein K2L82_04415 [Lachnospiraceae bacterium]|nr:hypothetical protein [Lachnospiraceae bacterium]
MASIFEIKKNTVENNSYVSMSEDEMFAKLEHSRNQSKEGRCREADLDRFIRYRIEDDTDGVWYHGSNVLFSELRTNSTITQWKELAEAFSHQPSALEYNEDGVISHNGVEKGYLYIIDEPVDIQNDIYQHPRTTMDENVEFLTKRPLKVKIICEL